jgi:small subunit ribosomal protein S4e
MGRKGNRRHMKRYSMPKMIHAPRKQFKFIMKHRPGPHPIEYSITLGHLIRDILKIARNAREARYILNHKEVMVDGKYRKDYRFPIGFMDVVAFPRINKYYRILTDDRQGMYPIEITKDEAEFKLCQIMDKTTVRKGHIQLNLHDGRSILLKVEDPKKKNPVQYSTMTTLKIKIPTQEIIEEYPLQENAQGYIFRGKNMGIHGKITKIEKTFGVKASLINIESKQGVKKSTYYNYIFVIGKDKPAITLPE